MFKKRLTEYDLPTPGIMDCPDIWELDDGRVAVIGIRATDSLKPHLPSSAGCGLDEEIVIIPREMIEKLNLD